MNITGQIPNKKNYSVGKKSVQLTVPCAQLRYSRQLQAHNRTEFIVSYNAENLMRIHFVLLGRSSVGGREPGNRYIQWQNRLLFDDICLRRSSLCGPIGYHDYVLRAELCAEHTNPFVRLEDEVSLVIARRLT